MPTLREILDVVFNDGRRPTEDPNDNSSQTINHTVSNQSTTIADEGITSVQPADILRQSTVTFVEDEPRPVLKRSLPTSFRSTSNQSLMKNSQNSGSFFGQETYSSDESDDEVETGDVYIPKGGFGNGKNSIIPEVAATIPITDQDMPVITFRAFFIGTVLTIFSSVASQFSLFRYNPFNLDTISHLIIAYPMGVAFTALPRTWKFLNPGRFNIKEHALVAIICMSATFPYQDLILIIQRIYLGPNQYKDSPVKAGIEIGYWTSVGLIIFGRYLGFALAGLLNKFLVEPAEMWWPETLLYGNLLHSFHGAVTKKITGLRLKFFQYVVISIFLFQLLPELFAPLLQYVSVICLFAGGLSGMVPDNIFNNGIGTSLTDSRNFLGQIASGYVGGGLMVFAFDFNAIAAYAPIVTPLWSNMNVFFGNFALAWIATPLFIYYNFWDAQKFPGYGTRSYFKNGTVYNATSLINQTTLAITQDPPEIRLSTYRVVLYACKFAGIASVLTQFILNHWGTVKEIFMKQKSEEKKDVHAKLMENYQPVPILWYLILLLVSLALSMFVTLNSKQYFDIDWWGIPSALFVCILFALPIGTIQAISNQRIHLNVISQFIMGYLKPHSLLANTSFKVYCYDIMDQCMNYSTFMKLAYYIKVPPRATFVGILYGALISSITCYSTLDYLLKNFPEIWNVAHGYEDKSVNWNSQNTKIIFTAGTLFGIVGPEKAFGPGSFYNGIYWFFVVGALMPLIFHYLAKWFPKYGFEYFYWPIIFNNVFLLSEVGSNGLLSAFIFAIVFQYFIRKYHRRWYDRYGYTFAAGMDFALVLVSLIALSAYSIFPSLENVTWVLSPNSTLYGFDYCGNTSSKDFSFFGTSKLTVN